MSATQVEVKKLEELKKSLAACAKNTDALISLNKVSKKAAKPVKKAVKKAAKPAAKKPVKKAAKPAKKAAKKK